MFMGMFLQLNVDTTAKVHTRGEILDQYITKTENDAANQIAGRWTLPNGAACRKFVVCFSLPFAASAMDKDRSFIQLEAAVIRQITKGNIAYLVSTAGEYSVYELYTKSIIKAKSIGFSSNEYNIYSNKMSEEQAMKCFIGSDAITTLLIEETGYCYKASNNEIAFTHQYLRDYFAAKHIQNILNAAKALDRSCLSQEEQLQFINDNGLDYTWSDDVCMLLGDIIGDYKNEPGYVEG